jgi:hypothetical protein
MSYATTTRAAGGAMPKLLILLNSCCGWMYVFRLRVVLSEVVDIIGFPLRVVVCLLSTIIEGTLKSAPLS